MALCAQEEVRRPAMARRLAKVQEEA